MSRAHARTDGRKEGRTDGCCTTLYRQPDRGASRWGGGAVAFGMLVDREEGVASSHLTCQGAFLRCRDGEGGGGTLRKHARACTSMQKHAQSTHKARTKHAQSTHEARTKHARGLHGAHARSRHAQRQAHAQKRTRTKAHTRQIAHARKRAHTRTEAHTHSCLSNTHTQNARAP